MSTDLMWAEALGGKREKSSARIMFRRNRAVARCTALSGSEIAECIEMGGERGARYALYLSCQELRQAGQALVEKGELSSPFDITQRLAYGDVIAAARVVFSLSGGTEADIRVLDEDENEQAAIDGIDEERRQSVASSSKEVEELPWEQTASTGELLGQLDQGEVAAQLRSEDFFSKVFGGEKEVSVSRRREDAAAQSRSFISVAGTPWTEAESLASTMPAGNTAYMGLYSGEGQSFSDADQLARVFADRLRDAAGNM